MYKRIKDDYTDDYYKHREYADIYVDNILEAKAIDTDDYIQGSKLYVIETAQLFVLNHEGGEWRSAADGSPLA